MNQIEIILIGSGPSEGVPRVSCLCAQPRTCAVCASATDFASRNRRRNTSLLVRTVVALPNGQQHNPATVLIDVGKFYYDSAVQWFPYYGVKQIDAVVLTHVHADACGGLDDLRDWTRATRKAMPVFVRSQDMKSLRKTAYHLFKENKRHVPGGVARLDFHTIEEHEFEPAPGIILQPLPVIHGAPFTANGYRIEDMCYVSDVSEFPASTWQKMSGCRILILDALRHCTTYGSHLTVAQAVEVILELRPERAVLVGMSHEIDYLTTNDKLSKFKQQHGIELSLGYDGLRIGTIG